MAVVERDVPAPEGHYLVWGGEFENQKRAMKRLGVIIPISLLVVLLLLASALGSGRSALAHRFQKLGFQYTRNDIDVLYEQFLKVADRKKEVEDADLQELASLYQGKAAVM